MQATNGSAVSFRRMIGCVFALVLAVSAVFASSASAITVTHSDLALGDSLAFGYSQQLLNENAPIGDPASAFEHGYANYYFNASKAKATGDQLVNNGCPGETTDSMIGNGALGLALGETEGEAPCAYHNTDRGGGFHLPLHHEYGSPTTSQLENALGTIAGLNAAGKPVTTITLNIGANDELRQIAKCEAEAVPAETAAYEKAYIETLEKGGSEEEANANGKAAAEAAGKASVKACVEAHANELFGHILKNIGRIVFALKHGSLFVAGGVNYAGKLVFQGGYDPYGNVFGTGELLAGSNGLASLLNFHENKLLTDSGTEAAEEGHEPFGACFANPQPTFNPGNKTEPARLQKYTNMANFTESNGKKNGPDIHPTPTGYHALGATIMIKQCGMVE
jgi:hypothetical protein